MKKVIIIGGGIAGLSAGIYAKMAGFEAEIYEKNSVLGGNCSGWRRGDYYIDNCIHWMTGTKANTFQYKIWEELGALGSDMGIIKRDSFYSSEYNGEVITLWRDLERTEREMLALSPEDEKEIRKFIKFVRLAEVIQAPMDNPQDMINIFKDIYSTVTASELVRALVQYGRLSLETLSQKFKHPLLQKLILDFMAKEYESYWLILAYSIFTGNNGDLPEGGSMQVVNNMIKRFTELGGVIHTNSAVTGIHINRRKFKLDEIVSRNADGIVLANGTETDADYIICACDINYTFSHLLKKKYAPKRVKKLFRDKKEHRIYSSYQAAFAVDSEMPEINDTVSFDCEAFDVGRHSFDRMTVKNYRVYGDYIAPKGHTVIQCSIIQYKEDFAYWQKLYKNNERYNLEKRNIANAISYRIEKKFPQYEGRLKLLDSWTPVTYERRNNNYCGAYMRYITTVATSKAFLRCDIKHLGNVFLASHWLMYPGGIPTAATMGKAAVERIKKMESSWFKGLSS